MATRGQIFYGIRTDADRTTVLEVQRPDLDQTADWMFWGVRTMPLQSTDSPNWLEIPFDLMSQRRQLEQQRQYNLILSNVSASDCRVAAGGRTLLKLT